MKLIDCFMYFDEDLVLDIRLNTLYKKVDKFVIAEATRNHAGQNKKLNFKIEKFSKFKDKIHYLVIEDLPINVKSSKKGWHENHIRDQFQRNALERGYREFDDEDLIMISDIDEIPDPKKIKEFNTKNKYACFLQKNYQSKINLLNITDSNWAGTKICKKKYLKSPQWLRNFKVKKKSFWRIFKENIQLINDGGWHFSFLKDPESIRNKIISYSHQEYNNEEFTNLNQIEEKITKGSDLFNRDIQYKRVDVDQTFPKYIVNNKEKFKKWVI
jgi:beta-1,4-mannosyl-glycoprotein beta-1,4-N-acetylglucosaminyltransferase